MQPIDLLNSRLSSKIPDLTDPGPDRSEIDTILTAASRVPDHGKLIPWRFIVFAGDARWKAGERAATIFRARHPDATVEQIALEQARFARAPLVIAVVSRAAAHPKIPEWEQILSAGAAAMALALAVHAIGYASRWVTEWVAYDRDVSRAFGLSENERVAGFVHIGSAARPPEDRPRPALRDIVTDFAG